MKFFAALQFLTVIPLPRRLKISPDAAASSATYFPLVGFILGLVLAGWNWLLGQVLPAPVVNALLIALLAALTGALHLDGFLDTCDGLAGHRTVEERWRIMHDSRAGGIGVICAIILLLVKYVSLNSVPASWMMPALLLMPVTSRWAMVYGLFAYPYARQEGLGKSYKAGTQKGSFITATLITLAVAALLIPLINFAGFVIIAGAYIITLIVAGYLNRKLFGLTGDTYGAINELVEVSVLIMVIMLARHALS